MLCSSQALLQHLQFRLLNQSQVEGAPEHPGVNPNMTDLDIGSLWTGSELKLCKPAQQVLQEGANHFLKAQIFVLNLQVQLDSLNMFLVLETDLQLPDLLILQSKMFSSLFFLSTKGNQEFPTVLTI